LKADLYFDRIDFYKYLPKKDCGDCGFTCREFSRILKMGSRADKCPHLTKREIEFLNLAIEARKFLDVPILQTTVKTRTGLVFSDKKAVTLITANYPYTQAAVSEIMVRAGINFNMLVIDTEGYSVDMAVFLGYFRAERIAEYKDELEKVDKRKIVIPGLAEKFKDEITEIIGDVIVGPVCCAELPIFLLKKGLINNI
jgi:CO dehydrogenase/acetyl-CoA synthase gamma subunit (corrinoid Fe-S protein)